MIETNAKFKSEKKIRLKSLDTHRKKYAIAKGNSAASAHYWRKISPLCLDQLVEILGAYVTLPNNTQIQAKYQRALHNLSKLSKYAKKALVLPILKSASLISLGQLCDDNCCMLLNFKKNTRNKYNDTART